MDKDILNEAYKELYDVIGEDAMLRVYNLFRGQQITFPVRLYDSQQVRKIIAKEYDGSNILYLARRYNYSERSVRRMLKGESVKCQKK